MGSSRKIAFQFVIMILSGVAVGLVVLVGLQLAQDQSPLNSFAFGFGETANRDFNEIIADRLHKTSCLTFIQEKDLAVLGEYKIYDLQQPESHEAYGSVPVYCEYNLGSNKKLTFAIYSYPAAVALPADQESLFLDVNNVILKEVYSSQKFKYGEYFTMNHFYGPKRTGDAGLTGDICASTLYHNWNDFNYALVTYQNMGECESIIQETEIMVSVLSTKIDKLLEKTYAQNGITEDDYTLIFENYNIPL